MNAVLQCIMLIDDNSDDNFYHERVIKKNKFAEVVLTESSAEAALTYLQQKAINTTEHPDLIFLDINMPGMNGWDFLEAYGNLAPELRSQSLVIMLSTSENPDDVERANQSPVVSDFKTKPITKEVIEDIIAKHFSNKTE